MRNKNKSFYKDKEGKKIYTEEETRKRLIGYATAIGCLPELMQLINRFDNLLKNCQNEKERQAISTLGIIEIHNLFGGYSSLEINGKKVLDSK